MKYLFLIVIGLLLNISNAHSQSKEQYNQRISSLKNRIETDFKDPKAGLYLETNGQNEKPFSYLWPLCALVQSANEYEVLQSKEKYLDSVLKSIDKYYSKRPPAPGYQAYVSAEGNDSRFYDDNQWIAIACLDAYERTHNAKYLTKAKMIYTFMMTGYDQKSGGGLYWKEDEKNTKNTCSNGPGIIIALQLYKATKEEKYFQIATDLYDWTNQHLRASSGVFYDAIKIPSMKIDSATYSYNTGTMLQSNVLLYELTNEDRYLDEAKFIAKAAKSHFYTFGKLPGHYWFNVVLLRGFQALYEVEEDKERWQFFVNDAERIWNEEKDSKGLVGHKPTKTLIDQAAMMEMYARLAEMKGV